MLGNSGAIVPIEYTTISGNLPSSSGFSNYYQYPSDWVNFDNIVLVSFEWYRADSGD